MRSDRNQIAAMKTVRLEIVVRFVQATLKSQPAIEQTMPRTRVARASRGDIGIHISHVPDNNVSISETIDAIVGTNPIIFDRSIARLLEVLNVSLIHEDRWRESGLRLHC